MAWEEKDLFKLMVRWNDDPSYRIFELPDLEVYRENECPIEDAVKFFEVSLYNLLVRSNFYGSVNSDFTNVKYNGMADISRITRNDQVKFNLTAKQCIDIAMYIYGKILIKDCEPILHWTDFYIVMNYIYYGIELNELNYAIVYSPTKVLPSNLSIKDVMGYYIDSGCNKPKIATNEEVLQKIADDVKEQCMKYKFSFDDPLDYDHIEKSYDSLLSKIIPDGLITESINKTGYPDSVVMMFATSRGMKSNSVNDFSEITRRYEIDNDNNLMWLRLNYTMKDSTYTTSYTINI